MKSPTAYYLMLLYITVMLKPLIPIISNVWSHEFNEIEHISTIHAKYGSHHLQKELAASGTDNENSKNQGILKSDIQYSFHVLTDAFECIFTPQKIHSQYLFFLLNKLPLVHIFNQSPPPKFSL